MVNVDTLNEIINGVVISLAAVIIILIVYNLYKWITKVRKPTYMINIIIRANSDYLIRHKTNKLNFKFKMWKGEYNVNKDVIYLKRRNVLRKIFDKIRHRIDKECLILFYLGEPNAIQVTPGKTDPVLINTVRTSRIYGKALKEIVARAMERKGVIFMVILIIIISLAVTKYLGYW